jgi:hypothetical protein
VLVFISGLVFTAAAHAEEPSGGSDEVTLKDGGTVRGTVTTVEPGKAVQIIEGGSKEVRVLPWAKVANIAKAKYADGVKSATAGTTDEPHVDKSSSPQSDAPPAKDVEGVRVHIDSPVHADLYRLRTHVSTVGVVAPVYGYYGYGVGYVGTATVASTSEEALCTAPCDKVVPADTGDQYVIRGDFPSTKKFMLSGAGDAPRVTLTPGSKSQRAGGIVMASGGGVSMLGGIIGLIIGASSTISVDSHGIATTEHNTTALAVGGTMLGVGTALLGGGIALAATSGSKVDVVSDGANHPGSDTAITIAPWIGAPQDPRAKTDAVVGVRGAF